MNQNQYIGYMQKSAAINWSDISKGISEYWNGLSPETRKYLPYLLAGGAGAIGGGLLSRRWGGALAGGLGGAGALALARWLMSRGQSPAASAGAAPETDYGMGAVRRELGLTPAAKPTPEEIQAEIRSQYSPEAAADIDATNASIRAAEQAKARIASQTVQDETQRATTAAARSTDMLHQQGAEDLANATRAEQERQQKNLADAIAKSEAAAADTEKARAVAGRQRIAAKAEDPAWVKAQEERFKAMDDAAAQQKADSEKARAEERRVLARQQAEMELEKRKEQQAAEEKQKRDRAAAIAAEEKKRDELEAKSGVKSRMTGIK